MEVRTRKERYSEEMGRKIISEKEGEEVENEDKQTARKEEGRDGS